MKRLCNCVGMSIALFLGSLIAAASACPVATGVALAVPVAAGSNRSAGGCSAGCCGADCRRSAGAGGDFDRGSGAVGRRGAGRRAGVAGGG